MNLNELKDRAYKIAREHGWHDEEHSDETYLMLIVTEIAEAVNADRKGKHADVAKFKEWQGNSLPLSEETRSRRFKEDFEAYIKDSVEEELSDVVIRCLSFAGQRRWNLQGIKVKDLDISHMEDTYQENTFAAIAFYICEEVFYHNHAKQAVSNTIESVIGYCKWRGIDLEWHIEQKMRYNELRDYKHGGKRY